MESTPEEAAEGLAIVRVLAAVLDRLVCANSPLARTEPGQVTKFHALKAPGIGIQQYLERIHKYASCSSQCFIMALIYIDRLIQRNNFLLTELNVHRVIVTAILLAAKFFDDAYYNNAYYAKVGGVLVSEMNGLEVDFLFRINFSLHVTPELFEQYRAELLSHSGTDTFPLGPPPQQYMEPQHHPLAPMLPQQPYVSFPMTATGGPPQPIPAQITPSPTRPPSSTSMVMPNSFVKPVEDEVMVSIHQPTLQSNLPSMFGNQDFGYLQRANSLPVQTNKSLVNQGQCAQQQPLSAPAMMAIGFPGLVDDPFVVVENQLYPLPQPHDHRVMNATDLIHHVHHPVGSHGFVSREASQRFATGQMVAGVSGGL